MVLSAPPAHATPVEHWLDRLVVAIELSAGGVLTLVDGAAPARLREAYLRLHAVDPRTELIVDVRGLAELPAGSTVILAIAPQISSDDLDWLNLNRPVLSDRGHRVILWCQDGAAAGLARGAPDFFDWISARIDCPPAPAAHAVADVQAAIRARAPGIAWAGPGLEDTLAAVRPGRAIRRVAVASYPSMIDALSARAPGWLVLDGIHTGFHLRRLQWAMAETGRRVIVFRTAIDESLPGWWTVHAEHAPVHEAVHDLVQAGGAGRLAALAGLDPATCAYAGFLLRRHIEASRLESLLVTADHPRAALHDLVRSLGAAPAQAFTEQARPWLANAMRRDAERAPRSDEVSPDPVVEALRQQPLTAESWAGIGTIARNAGDDEVAIRWLTTGMRALPVSGIRLHIELLVQLGQAHRRAGDLHVARAELEQAHALANTGDEPSLIARSAAALGQLALDRGELQRAREYLEPAVHTSAVIEDETLASWHEALAMSLVAQNDLSAARPYFNEALARWQRAFTSERPHDSPSKNARRAPVVALVPEIMRDIARLIRDKGDPRSARTVLDRALALQRTTLGRDHPEVARTLVSLGVVLTATGEHDTARATLDEALTIQQKVFGDDGQLAGAMTRREIARLLVARGDLVGAVAQLQLELATLRRILAREDHPEIVAAQRELARLQALQHE